MLISIISTLLLSVSMFVSGADDEAPIDDSKPTQMLEEQLIKERGYFFGYSFGNALREGGNQDIDMQSLIEGFNDSLSELPPTLTGEQITAIRKMIIARREQLQREFELASQNAAETNLAAAIKFMAENQAKEGVQVTDSGLQYLILTDVDGPRARSSDTVSVNYIGKLLNGTVFDQSHGTPVEFEVQQVILGWIEGIQLMSAGDNFRLFIPPDLAYGPGGVGGIPPNSALIFDVELLEIK